MAAAIGGVCGTVGGYWSQGSERSVAVPAATAAIAAPAPPVRVEIPPPEVVAPPAPQDEKPQTAPVPVAPAALQDPLQAARELAKRIDVTGLIALREDVASRAEQAGERDAPETKQRLDVIDRYLAEARALRLKLDAAEFRKSAPPREQQE